MSNRIAIIGLGGTGKDVIEALSRYDVFISYGAYSDHGSRIARRLRKAAFSTYLWVRHGTHDEREKRRALNAFERSASCALLFGPDARSPLADEWLRSAIRDRVARTRGEYRVIPVLLPSASKRLTQSLIDEMCGFKTKWAVLFQEGNGEKESLHQLILAIRGVEPGQSTDWQRGWFREYVRCRAENALNVDWAKLARGNRNPIADMVTSEPEVRPVSDYEDASPAHITEDYDVQQLSYRRWFSPGTATSVATEGVPALLNACDGARQFDGRTARHSSGVFQTLKECAVRLLHELRFRRRTTENQKRNILLLEANPDDTPPLRLSEEIRIITNACERSRRREEFGIEVRTGVTSSHLRRAILDCKPEIFHFSGHGSGAQGMVFEGETTGIAQTNSTVVLADTFRLSAKYGAVCVLLNACHLGLQVEQAVKYIPYVIGMRSQISDKAALKFSEGFYDNLFAGEPFGDCYEWGVNALYSAGIPEHSTPRFKVKEPQLTPCQMVAGRFYYANLVEDPTPLGDTSFSIQRAHALVWQIFDAATNKILFIEQTFLNLRSDRGGFLLPYTSELVFEETQKEADAGGTQDTVNTLADIKRIRCIPLDDFTLDTSNQDLLNRFEAAKRSLLSTFPAGDAKWYVNDRGQLEKVIDYRNGRPPVVYVYKGLEK
jgi:hypothetical protein